MSTLFNGVCTALVTPFKNKEVDFKAFGNLIQRQLGADTDALCILGTTGEASTLTTEEKHAIIKFSLETVAGKVPIVFGIGGNNPKDIIELGKFIAKTPAIPLTKGGIGVMVTAPYYNKCTQDGAVEFFNTVANAIKLPMIVYNVPGRTGVNLEPETIARICINRYICGVKEASGNIEQIANVVRLCKKPVYSGDDTIALPCYAVGCRGIISVASNVRPKEVREIWLKRSKRLFLCELPFYRSLFVQVNPIPVKRVLAGMGLINNELRLPLTAME